MSKTVHPIRVLVVDDSSFMRNRLSMMLMKCADIHVVGTAKNGQEAIEQVKRTQPDVMTLDIEMPGMNGLEVLDHMMAEHPLPIIMVSALTEEGAAVTLEALERGAVDYLAKPMNHVPFERGEIEELLPVKVREAYGMRHRLSTARHRGLFKERATRDPSSCFERNENRPSGKASFKKNIEDTVYESSIPTEFPLVIIGASTGGPNLLKSIIRDLPQSFSAALLIVQHMPKFFTKVFAQNLDAVATIPIQEAQDGDVLRPGVGFVAPGDHHVLIKRQVNGRAIIRVATESLGYPYRPSVDAAMAAGAKQFGRLTIGLVLTGMGNDGMAGSQKIKEHGGTVLAQDKTTSLIYGMPRVVVEAGLADMVVPDFQLSQALMQTLDAVCCPKRQSGYSNIRVPHIETPHV